jgi:hypothetical protein
MLKPLKRPIHRGPTLNDTSMEAVSVSGGAGRQLRSMRAMAAVQLPWPVEEARERGWERQGHQKGESRPAQRRAAAA